MGAGRDEVASIQSDLSLRQQLKTATAAEHDRLDARLGALDLARAGDYARFLQVQYAARAAIERWLENRCTAFAEPPPQTPAIARDLAATGHRPAAFDGRFDPSGEIDALGVAWVLAGSSLGNKPMLAGLSRRGQRPRSADFLADSSMIDYFRQLRPTIERPVEAGMARSAIAGARAAFHHFEQASEVMLDREYAV